MIISDISAPNFDSPNTALEILDNAYLLSKWLKPKSDIIEVSRSLPDDVVEALTASGVFRMSMPQNWGGPEMTSVEQLLVIEAISEGDASAAWCAMTGSDSGLYSGYLDDTVARDLFPHLDVVQAGWIYPGGIAEEVEGGYKVSGQWKFCSGSNHADVIAAGCIVHRNGRPVLDAMGRPEWRIMLALCDHWKIQDTWESTGLRGSGSHDYTTHSQYLVIPREHSFSFQTPKREGLLWQLPDSLLRKMSGVPLGLARKAIEDFKEIMDLKSHPSRGEYKKLPRVQSALAEAEMMLGSARSYVLSSLESQWHLLERTGSLSNNLSNKVRADVWLSRMNSFQMARNVTRLLYDTVGGDAVYTHKSSLDRALRDAETMCQHWVAQKVGLESVGEMMFGVDGPSPRSPML